MENITVSSLETGQILFMTNDGRNTKFCDMTVYKIYPSSAWLINEDHMNEGRIYTNEEIASYFVPVYLCSLCNRTMLPTAIENGKCKYCDGELVVYTRQLKQIREQTIT